MTRRAAEPAELAGARVLLTPQRRVDALAAALERRGATTITAPVMSTLPHVNDAELLARTRELIETPPDVVVVTTGVGFTGWVEAADAAGLAGDLVAALRGARIVARGPKANGAIQTHGLTPDWVAESETSGEIRDLLLREGLAGLRVAVQHHGSGADGLDEAFAEAGAGVVSLIVYRWGPAPDPAAVAAGVRMTAAQEVDAVVFTSAPGSAAFLDAATEQGLREDVIAACVDPSGVMAAAVGDVTAGPLREVGIDPVVPERARMGALVRTVIIELGERRGLMATTAAGPLRLLRGAAVLDGEVLALSPASLATLRALAEARGAVVPRAELLRVLPGESKDDHAVEMAIARLRSGLGDSALVETVPRRGYRLAVG